MIGTRNSVVEREGCGALKLTVCASRYYAAINVFAAIRKQLQLFMPIRTSCSINFQM